MDNSLRVCLVLFLAGTLVAAQRAATALGSAGVALRLRRNRARSWPPRPARNQAKSSAIKCYPLKSSIKAFTLIELIVVIIIVGILAAMGINQYSKMVEKTRGAEAKIIFGVIRKLAYEYRLQNGSITGMSNSDVNIGAASDQIPSACRNTHCFYYDLGSVSDPTFYIYAFRCTSGGKSPQGTTAGDFIRLGANLTTGVDTWTMVGPY